MEKFSERIASVVDYLDKIETKEDNVARQIATAKWKLDSIGYELGLIEKIDHIVLNEENLTPEGIYKLKQLMSKQKISFHELGKEETSKIELKE